MKYIAILFVILFNILIVNAKQYTIINSNYTFSPSTLTVMKGDTINFQIASIHNVVEVSKSTWAINGNASNGGFSLPYGGGQIIMHDTGSFYYVCQPHASMKMKGLIVVEDIVVTSVNVNSNTDNLKIYPNPVRGNLNLYFNLKTKSNVELNIVSITGEVIQQIHLGNLSNGGYFKSINLNRINKQGRYFLMLVSDNERYTKPFIVIR